MNTADRPCCQTVCRMVSNINRFKFTLSYLSSTPLTKEIYLLGNTSNCCQLTASQEFHLSVVLTEPPPLLKSVARRVYHYHSCLSWRSVRSYRTVKAECEAPLMLSSYGIKFRWCYDIGFIRLPLTAATRATYLMYCIFDFQRTARRIKLTPSLLSRKSEGVYNQNF